MSELFSLGYTNQVNQLKNAFENLLVYIISHLDYLKKTTATARVAIRFLEHETHSGNRFLRLQRPEEQPEKLAQLSRWASGRKVAKSESPDGAPPATGPPDDGDPVANPRVVKRWLSILDCAVYFSQV
ncbi:unnamed protein product [Dicrocoelium dendriticum]|nr:unnamed protein product [Dicrocoelium dendriticum]